MMTFMNRRAEEIKKRIAKRKRERMNWPKEGTVRKESQPIIFDEETYGSNTTAYYDHNQSKSFHPLFRSDIFMMKLLIASCLVLITAIVFKNEQPPFQEARSFVKNTLEKEFEFAAVSKWYKEQFGDPVAFISKAKTESKLKEEKQFAVPASGKVLESFQDNGQGVTIETANKTVEAMNEGIVIEAGKMDETGLTVIVQHADGTESWYGNLESIDVALYDFVEMGAPIGKVKHDEHEQGTYYFAIKKGDQFIDPNQVISFE